MSPFVLPEPVPNEVCMVVSMSQLIAMISSNDPAGAIRSIENLPMLPVDMVLHCPQCQQQHIDAPEPISGGDELCITKWNNPPHRSHKCYACGCIWRPADIPTNGVERVRTRGKHDTWPI